MDTEDYVQSMYQEHVQDISTYLALPYDPTNAIAREVKNCVEYFHYRHRIDDTTRDFLMPFDPPRTPTTYGT